MRQESVEAEGRRLRLITRHGPIEGQVRVNPRVSTLRFLNLIARSQSFIVIGPPIESANGWSIAPGPLALAIDSLLFVQEVLDYGPSFPSDRAAAALYERCAVRMSVGEYAVEGFLHLPPGSNPIARLNPDRHAFFALSAVSVLGPDAQFAAAFLAVKRSEVIALQAIGKDVALDDSVESEVVATC